jgi:hypothetical protein
MNIRVNHSVRAAKLLAAMNKPLACTTDAFLSLRLHEEMSQGTPK